MKQGLFLLFTILISISFGQGEANIWYFGTQAGLNFNVNPPAPLTNGALSTAEGCAVISDAGGNLLFYTDGSTVWTQNHTVMANGTGLMGNSSSAQSAVIIPKPGSSTNYYIITVPVTGTVGMRYSEVDMTLNGGLGGVLAGNKNTFLFSPSSEKVTAVKHANGVYYWLIGRENSMSKKYLSFLIDCDGINPAPVESTIGITNGENWGYLIASPDGSRLASASNGSGVEITEFDTSTGVVSNPVFLGSLNYAGATGGNYGVAFSPNSELLYATSIHSWALVQWDLTVANIPSTQTLIGYTNGNGAARPAYRGGALQLASDGKIYVAEVGLSSVGVINNPNVLGTGCNFVPSQVGLAGRVCRLGLPPFVTSFLIDDSGITHINDCVSDSIEFNIMGVMNLDSVKWDFGEPFSPSNESTLFNPKHRYSAPGVYTITLIRYVACIEDTVIRDITVHDYKRYTKNISLCYGESYTLPDGTLINESGTYIDTLATTSFPACDSIVTTIITAPYLSFDVSGDTAICIGESVQLYADGGIEYIWDPHPSLSATDIPDPVATPGSTTTYVIRTKMQVGDNLVENGDFESGNTGFTSEYIYSTPTPLGGPGHYTVAPSVSNGWWPGGCGDHTTGSGNSLIADGANGTNGVPAGANYWCQSIQIEPDTDYAFSAWLTNANSSGATSLLGFYINGVQVGVSQETLLASCQWNEFYVIWNSGSNTTANICLSETGGNQPGNDFAIDDISFYKLCEVVDSVTVTVSDPQSEIVSQVNVSCNGLSDGAAEANVSGGISPYAYSWDTSPVQATAAAGSLSAGTYSVTITDSIGCIVSSSVAITEPALLVSSITGQENVTCNGFSNGTAEVTVSGGTTPYSYSWNTAPVQTTDAVDSLPAGTYSVTITDSNSCTTTSSVTVTEPQPLDLSLVNQENVTCNGLGNGTAEVTASGGTVPYSYGWNTTPAQTTAAADNLFAGTYIVTVTDSNNCELEISVVITEPDPLLLALTADQSLVCPNESTSISGSASGGTAPYGITWDQGLIDNQWVHAVSAAVTTIYTAIVTDAHSCTHSAQITIEVVELPVVDFQGDNLVGCVPLTANFQNLSTGNAANCIWTFSDGTILQGCGNVSNVFTALGCHDLTLTVYTAEGCSGSLTAADFICTEPAPIAGFTTQSQVFSTINTSVDFNNLSQNAVYYQWDFGDGSGYSTQENPSYEYQDELLGTYTVTLMASNLIGCVDTAVAVLKIKEEQLFFVPNTFTPDGDQFNQTFKPVITSGVDIYNYRLSIFNRWGELIFESRNPEIGWDGVSFLTGILAQDGTYTWKIELKTTDNDEKKVVTGSVNLIR